jgi:hypothetical protein
MKLMLDYEYHWLQNVFLVMLNSHFAPVKHWIANSYTGLFISVESSQVLDLLEHYMNIARIPALHDVICYYKA